MNRCTENICLAERVEVDPFEPDQTASQLGLVGSCAGGKLMGITRAGPRKARDEDVVLGIEI
ncbi:hypothetical protein FCM35_KLT13986 [Carex littledalei]|uniref:Uncharacterized protein n=1 Tax=Carex littledalei TaxID=544730 RepID=A0A833QCM3_9POAL|nr:hypothetical protein FCM35_KLT13986 [Carex littledalei]